MRFWHWFIGLNGRNLLPHAARLEKQSGVKRLESEHYRSLRVNALLALTSGLDRRNFLFHAARL